MGCQAEHRPAVGRATCQDIEVSIWLVVVATSLDDMLGVTYRWSTFPLVPGVLQCVLTGRDIFFFLFSTYVYEFVIFQCSLRRSSCSV